MDTSSYHNEGENYYYKKVEYGSNDNTYKSKIVDSLTRDCV